MQHKSVEVPFDMKFSYACEMHVFFQNYNITHFVDLIDKKGMSTLYRNSHCISRLN